MTNVYYPIRLKCTYCERIITKQNFESHTRKCKENPEVVERLKKSIHVCEECGSEFDSYTVRTSTRFCSKRCSSTFSRKHNDKNELKPAKCVSCEKVILIKKNASEKGAVRCDSCKQEVYKQRRIQKAIEIRSKRGYSSEGNLNCSFCKKSFKGLGALKNHERSCEKNPDQKTFFRKDIRTGYIYKTTCLITNKIYVGKRKGDPNTSISYLGSGIVLLKAIKKYGRSNFKKEILEIIVEGDLNERERYWIKTLNTKGTEGYNLTEGGDGGPLFKGKHHSEETKNKLRQN